MSDKENQTGHLHIIPVTTPAEIARMMLTVRAQLGNGATPEQMANVERWGKIARANVGKLLQGQ